jgi:hypothetical protein
MPGPPSSTPGQIHLPGQAAAPDGPVDLTGMFAMHWAFRRDLDRFVAAAIATPVTDRPAWRALADRWALFRKILHDHHTGEDAGIWPELLTRLAGTGTSDADMSAGRQVLAAMASEHRDLDPLLDSVADGLAQLAAGAGNDSGAALGVRTAAARHRLTQHLGHEEREALALVQRYLRPADWKRVTERHFVRPKTVRQSIAVVAWVMHELPDADAARLLVGAAPVRILWRLFLRGPFARRERRVFRYVA